VKSTVIKVRISLRGEVTTVAGRYLDSRTVLFRMPEMNSVGMATVEVALNGVQFAAVANANLEVFAIETSALNPSHFVRDMTMPMRIEGSGFPTSAPNDCKVSFYLGTEEQVAPATVESSTSILVSNPVYEEYSGPLNVSISFDNGTRFIETSLVATAYSITVMSVDPAILSTETPSIVSLYGKGFFPAAGASANVFQASLMQSADENPDLGPALALQYIDENEMRLELPSQPAGDYAILVRMGQGHAGVMSLKQIRVLPGGL